MPTSSTLPGPGSTGTDDPPPPAAAEPWYGTADSTGGADRTGRGSCSGGPALWEGGAGRRGPVVACSSPTSLHAGGEAGPRCRTPKRFRFPARACHSAPGRTSPPPVRGSGCGGTLTAGFSCVIWSGNASPSLAVAAGQRTGLVPDTGHRVLIFTCWRCNNALSFSSMPAGGTRFQAAR